MSTAPPDTSVRAPWAPITAAPYVRSPLDLVAALRCVGIAALPCVAVAVYNAGYQARAAVASDLATAGDWRLRALESLGAPVSSTQAGWCIAHGLAIFVPLFLAALGAGALAERGFARLRRRRPDHTALVVIALLFTLCLPPSLPIWQAALGAFVAVAVGKELFGGFGHNFINPTLVGVAFLYFAYPGALSGDAVWVAADGYSGATPLGAAQRGGLAELAAAGWSGHAALWGRVPGALGETSALACAIGLAVLLYTGVASWRVVAGGALGLFAMTLCVQATGSSRPLAELPWHWHAISGGFAFGLVFLATDPVTSAVTDPGRWLYGLTIGALVVLLRVANPAHHESTMLAIVLGNVLAPLFDQIAARVQARWRRRTHVD